MKGIMIKVELYKHFGTTCMESEYRVISEHGIVQHERRFIDGRTGKVYERQESW